MFLKTTLSKRNSIFLKNTLYNYILKALFIGINLLMTPLLLSALGKERFGIWQTILSVISLISVLNFGLGNGLRNFLAKMNSNNDKSIGIVIGATYKKISKIIFVVIIILLPLAYFFLEPQKLFIDTKINPLEIKNSILIFLFFFSINIILSLSDSIAFGLQRSYLTGIVQFFYLLSSYILIYILSRLYSLNLIQISLIFGVTQTIFYLIFIFYQNNHLNLNINFKTNFDLTSLTKLSFNFFLIQLLSLVFLSIDNFIISSTLGPSQTAEFSIVNRIFFTIINLFSVLLIHFWNSVTEAYEKNEIEWIHKTLKMLYKVSIGVLLLGLIISFYHNSIINLWLGKNTIQYTSTIFYLFSIYTFFHCVNAIFINLQNGLGMLKLQIYSTILALTFYIIGVYMIDISKHGYNTLVVLKIIAVGLSIIINVKILKKIN